MRHMNEELRRCFEPVVAADSHTVVIDIFILANPVQFVFYIIVTQR